MPANQMECDAPHCLRSPCGKCVAKFCRKMNRNRFRYLGGKHWLSTERRSHERTHFHCTARRIGMIFSSRKSPTFCFVRAAPIQMNCIKFYSLQSAKPFENTESVGHFMRNPRFANNFLTRNAMQTNTTLCYQLPSPSSCGYSQTHYVAIVISQFSSFHTRPRAFPLTDTDR